jgi:hypothetical protein
MTRAAFVLSLALAAAAAAQQAPPLPLPGGDPNAPALPLPSKPEAKKKDKKEKKEKEPAAGAALPLPGLDANKPSEAKGGDVLPLPGLDANKPGEAKPAETKAAETKPAAAPAAAPAAPPPSAPPAAPPATAAPRPTPSATPTTTTLKATPQPAPKAGAAAAAPVAASAVQVGDIRLRPNFDENLWGVHGFVGGERSTEQGYTDPTSYSRVSAEVTRWFSETWIVRGQLDWRASTQTYVPLNAATNQQITVDENRFDITVTAGYDFGPKMAQSGRLEFTPMLGVNYIAIRNQAFPSDIIGPEIGGRVRWSLSPAVIAHATLGYTYNFSTPSTQNSALKSPKGVFATRAGLALPLQGGYSLELDYTGDVIAFENVFRVAHGAALGFGTSF